MSASLNRKTLGKYYTPRALAQTLVDWGIRKPGTNFLDPSFGGCSFLHAAVARLQELGTGLPGRYVFGVDVDRSARQYLAPILRAGASECNFLTTDFLTLNPQQMPGVPFQAICGNPPFVRHSLLSRRRFNNASEAIKNSGCKIPGNASYWAYFVIHSLQFLGKGGRMAMILPTSFLYADYSRKMWACVKNKFGSIRIFPLNGLMFDDAQEAVVVLLASEFLSPNEHVDLALAPSLSGLAQMLLPGSDERSYPISHGSEERWAFSLVRPHSLETYEKVVQSDECSKLGEWADVRIGVVTGCNDFFVLRKSARKNLGISTAYVQPVVTRGSYVKGLEFTRDDYLEISRADKPSHLFHIESASRMPTSVASYISLGRRRGVHKRFKCSVRDKWYSLNDFSSSDAFIHYMSSSLPHLVLNRSKATCTNAIHRVRFAKKVDAETAQCLALASITSLTQLSVEIVGRSYGGGVLKLEPSEAREMVLVVPSPSGKTARAFHEIDCLLRKGEKEAAVSLADKVVLVDFFRLGASDVRALRTGWRTLAKLRSDRAESSGPLGEGIPVQQGIGPATRILSSRDP